MREAFRQTLIRTHEDKEKRPCPHGVARRIQPQAALLSSQYIYHHDVVAETPRQLQTLTLSAASSKIALSRLCEQQGLIPETLSVQASLLTQKRSSNLTRSVFHLA